MKYVHTIEDVSIQIQFTFYANYDDFTYIVSLNSQQYPLVDILLSFSR